MRALVLLVSAAVLAGCTDDDGADGHGNGGTGTGDGSDEGPQVSMEGFTFFPSEISIAVGETVTWTNVDSQAHTATGDDFDTGELQQGETGEHTFTAAGTFEYRCTIHGMKGTVNAA